MTMLDRLRGGTVARHYQVSPERFRGLTAAAEPLPAAGEFASLALGRRPQWQTEAWAYYDTLGETAYGANFVGDALARLRLYITDPDDPDHEPVPEEDDPEAYEVLSALGPPGPILHDLGVNVTVVGECLLVGVPPEDGSGPDSWSLVSTDAMDTDQGRWMLREDASGRGRRLPDETYVARIWQAHPRRRMVADAPFRPVLSSCEELLMLEAADRAALRTRLVAPLLAIPEGASIVNPDPTVEAQGPSQFARDLQRAMIEPVADESHPSRLSPIVIEAKGEFLENMRTISLQSSLDATIGERYERNLKRLSLGLWVPAEVLTGVADVNNWNAWFIERNTWKAHLQPRAIFAVNALTSVFLVPALGRADRAIWFDPADIVNPTPTGEDAHKAFAASAISPDAYRARLGFDDGDAPTGDPVTRQVISMLVAAPSLATQPGARVLYDDLAALPGIAGEDATPPPAEDDEDGGDGGGSGGVGGGEPDPGPPSTGPTAAAAGSPPLAALSEGLADADSAAFDRLTEAAEANMEQTVRRAGARIRSAAKADSQLSTAIDRIDNVDVPKTLGRDVAFALDDNLAVEDSVDRLKPRFLRIVADAQTRAAELLEGQVSPEAAEQYRQEAAEDVEPAWTWLRTALVAAALAVMFDPAPAAEGEADPTARVQASLVREALARAGGADTVRAVAGRIRDVEVALRARSVATSVRLINLLSEFGIAERALQWDYRPGIVRDTFPQHAALNGVTAESEDAAAFGGCPWGQCRPSDHRGCRCAFRAVLAPQPEAA